MDVNRSVGRRHLEMSRNPIVKSDHFFSKSTLMVLGDSAAVRIIDTKLVRSFTVFAIRPGLSKVGVMESIPSVEMVLGVHLSANKAERLADV